MRIWLNKIHILCEQSQSSDSGQTLLVDSGLASKYGKNTVKETVQRTLEVMESAPSTSTELWYFPYEASKDSCRRAIYNRLFCGSTRGKKTWFGSLKCRTTPKVMGGVLAVKNGAGACAPIVSAFEASLMEVADETSTSCPCFDEEIVLTRMLSKYPNLFRTIPY